MMNVFTSASCFSICGKELKMTIKIRITEPCHEIMVLFVLRKLILQTLMRSYPMGLDVWFLVGPFVYFHTSSVRTAKALARLRRCAGSPEPSLVVWVINTIMSWAVSIKNRLIKTPYLIGMRNIMRTGNTIFIYGIGEKPKTQRTSNWISWSAVKVCIFLWGTRLI